MSVDLSGIEARLESITSALVSAGTIIWGAITGTLSDQADLQAALDAKENVGAAVSDTAYDATSWNGVTTVAPSKNAVRDKIETLGTAAYTASGAYDAAGTAAGLISDTAYDATSWNGVTTIAPSKNAVRDKIESLSFAADDTAYDATTWNGSVLAPTQNSVRDKFETLGTAAYTASGDYDVAGAAAAVTPTSLGLVIGTNVQAYDADLTTWAGVTPGTGVATFLATPTKANLNSAVSDADLASSGSNSDITATTALNTVTAASATNLALNAGSSGATLSLGQGTNGSATITTMGTGSTVISNVSGTGDGLVIHGNPTTLKYALNIDSGITGGGETVKLTNTATTGAAAVLLQNNAGTTGAFGLGGATVGAPYSGNFYFAASSAADSDIVFLTRRANSKIRFFTGSTPTDRWSIDGSGNFLATTDNTLDIGASGATRPRTVYAGTSVISPTHTHTGVTVANLPASPAAGQVAYVTDGSATPAWGDTVTGGGSTKILVWYNGTNWTAIGK